MIVAPAELRAVRAYLETGSVKAAAVSLGVSESTIKNQLSSVRSKLGVDTTAQAVHKLHAELAA